MAGYVSTPANIRGAVHSTTCANAGRYDHVTALGYCVGDTDQVGSKTWPVQVLYGVMDMAGSVAGSG